MPLATRIFLSLSAAILAAVGGTLTLAPHLLHADATDVLANSPLLTSDLRSGGSLLLFCAAFLVHAAWRGSNARLALMLTGLVFLGYGFGRLVGIVLDGHLDATLATVAGVEWAVGLLALGLLPRTARP